MNYMYYFFKPTTCFPYFFQCDLRTGRVIFGAYFRAEKGYMYFPDLPDAWAVVRCRLVGVAMCRAMDKAT